MMQNTTHTTMPAQRPLQVSTAPLPGDIRLLVHVAVDAPVGACEVAVGLGKGTKGRGERIGDDPAIHVATVRRLVAHLAQYARDYELAALECEPAGWWERLAAAGRLLDPTGSHPCTVCGQPADYADTCTSCIPF